MQRKASEINRKKSFALYLSQVYLYYKRCISVSEGCSEWRLHSFPPTEQNRKCLDFLSCESPGAARIQTQAWILWPCACDDIHSEWAASCAYRSNGPHAGVFQVISTDSVSDLCWFKLNISSTLTLWLSNQA